MTNEIVGKISANISEVMQRALHARNLPLYDRRIIVMSCFETALWTGTAILEEEIFEAAYGDRSGNQYWQGWFAEDFSGLYEFVDLLEIHGKKQPDLLYISRSPILEALAVAARCNSSWLRKINDEGEPISNAVLETVNHPQFLARWEICRGPAVQWLFKHPEFHELLPASVINFFQKSPRNSGGQGRPTSRHLILEEIERRKLAAAERMSRTQWSVELENWLKCAHPGAPSMKNKAIRNSQEIGSLLSKLDLLGTTPARPK